MNIAIDINDVIRDNMWQFRHIYQKYVDSNFDIELDDINSFDMCEVYPFSDKSELNKFKYVDYAYELFGRAECTDKMLPYALNDYLERTLRDLDDEYIPNVIFFSPFEMALTIQSTLAFLSGKTLRPREIYFPTDSFTIYDKADIIITAQPTLIDNCPEGKTVIKINKPYNKDCDAKYSFDSMMDIIKDENETVIKLLTGKSDESL